MDVIDAMEMINDDETYYYNTQNEEIVYELNEDDDYDFYIPLPTKYQINEYRIMSDFVRTIEDDTISVVGLKTQSMAEVLFAFSVQH